MNVNIVTNYIAFEFCTEVTCDTFRLEPGACFKTFLSILSFSAITSNIQSGSCSISLGL